MYHVIGTGFTAIVLYLISYFFYRNGFYTLQVHRRLWNSILAVAFVFTALAGLFLALQVNYKWNIPIIKSILKWHVEFGIGMATTGIFHLLWHFTYFRQFFKKKELTPLYDNIRKTDSTDIVMNLFIVGFISSSIQLLLLKEMMNISGGYELIAGTFLGSWLIGSATGAAMAGKSPLNDIRKINLIFSISPVISIFLLLILSRLYLKSGETPSFLVSMVYTFLVLIPFCFVSGFTFVKLISIARTIKDFIPGKSFSVETTGGIAAGITISLLSSGVLNTYQMILLIIISGLSYVLFSFFLKNKRMRLFVKFIILGITSIIIISSPDIIFRQLLLRGINVTGSEETPYGNITKAEYGGEESIYYNQRLLTYNDDAIEREEDIHYTLLQSEKPERILMISGSINSHLPEIMKYPVKKVVYVERDPALTKLEKSSAVGGFKDLIVENDDAFSYVRKTREKFDAVIVLLPPPSTLLLNRYYTIEFFALIKKRLEPTGIFSCSPGINPNYLNKESVNLYSTVYNSLVAVFKNVIPVAGNKLYFIASDKNLSTAFCELTLKKNISNVYVGPDFLSDDLITAKSNEVISLMDKKIKLNKSALPVASFYYQSYNLSKNLNEKIPAIVLLVLAFALPLLLIKRKSLMMYFSASALAGFEIIVLLILQLTMGNMYQLTGMILAGLMAGLAVGSGIKIRFLDDHSFGLKTTLLLFFYLIMGFVITSILTLKGGFGVVCLIVLSAFLPALLTGNLFREFTLRKNGDSDPSVVYSADLAGSALGFILFSGLVVPVFGIKVSLFLLSLLIFTGFLFGTVRNK